MLFSRNFYLRLGKSGHQLLGHTLVLLENKDFEARRILYAPRVGPKFHLWAQKRAFSWG